METDVLSRIPWTCTLERKKDTKRNLGVRTQVREGPLIIATVRAVLWGR